MAIFYVDYDGGSDSNDGTSFATRWKTISAATNPTVQPGDTIRIAKSPDPTLLGNGKWTCGPEEPVVAIQSVSDTTPIVVTANGHGFSNGDAVRLASVVDSALGEWVIQNVTTNTFELVGSTGVSSGVGGSAHRINYRCVLLDAAITANIDRCESNWSVSANVSFSLDKSNYKEGISSARFQLASGFTTGKIGYRTIPSLDLSGYQQVSFWIRQSAVLGDGVLELRLCSDASGDVPVTTIAIPSTKAANNFFPVVVDTGAALGASINSVSLYANTDPGSLYIYLDNIFASKASSDPDSLTLNSLIGKNTGGLEGWFPIQSVDGTKISIDNEINSNPNSARGYWGESETVPTYKREPLLTTPESLSTTSEQKMSASGTDGNRVLYSGGWDRTSMSVRDGETWYSGQNGQGIGISRGGTGVGTLYANIEGLNFCRYYYGAFDLSNVDNSSSFLGVSNFVGCMYGLYVSAVFDFDTVIVSNNSRGVRIWSSPSNPEVVTIGTLVANCNTLTPFERGATSMDWVLSINNVYASNNGGEISLGGCTKIGTIHECYRIGGNGIDIKASGVEIENITRLEALTGIEFSGRCSNCVVSNATIYTTSTSPGVKIENDVYAGNIILRNIIVHSNVGSGFGIEGGNNIRLYDCASYGASHAIDFGSIYEREVFIRNFNHDAANLLGGWGINSIAGRIIHLENINGDGRQETHIGTFKGSAKYGTDSTFRHAASGVSWKITTAGDMYSDSFMPIRMPLAQVLVQAGVTSTFSVWMYRGSSNISGTLYCMGRQVKGVESDVTNSVSAVGSWEQVSISLTPTQTTVIDLEVHASSAIVENLWVDDFSVA